MKSSTPLELDRRLTFVDFRRVPRYLFDVLVVGGGAGGAAAALAAAREGASVAVLCKRALEEGNTRYALGGMAAVLSPGDSFDEHIADTLRAATSPGAVCYLESDSTARSRPFNSGSSSG